MNPAGSNAGRTYRVTSAAATNPLIDYTSTNQETAPNMSMTTSSTKIGLEFDPVVMLMIHLYN